MSYSSEVLADSPLVYWRLGESSGTTAADSSGNSRSATYTNSPTLGATGLLTSDSNTAMGVTSNTGSCASVADAAWMNVSSITVECLVNLSSTTDSLNGDAVVSRLTNLDWVLLRSPSGTWEASVWNNSGTRFNAIGGAVTVGATYHLAMTFNGTSLILYVNGSAAATTAVSGTVATLSAPIEVGRYSAANSTTPSGVIDEVAVYGTALSSTRIAAHYTAATTSGTAASGTGSLSLSGLGSAATSDSGTGALSLSASGSDAAAASASGSLSLSGSGTSGGILPASGSGSLAFSASGGVAAATAGSAALIQLAAGGAAGDTSGTGSISLSGSGGATSSMSASGSGSLTLSLVQSAPVSSAAALVLSGGGVALVLYRTDTSNAFDGLDVLLTATVTFPVTVVAPPSTLVLTHKRDKAIPYPKPTMVGGRPT